MKKRALKSAVIAIEVIAVGIAIFAAALFFLFWRLGQGPVNLDLVRPSVEFAIERRLPRGYDAKIASIDLQRTQERGGYELRLSEVVILDTEDQAAANAPEMLLTFGAGDFIGGRIGPRTVTVDGARFRIVRRENLNVDIPIVKNRSKKRNAFSLSKALNGGLLKSAFQSAAISNAELTFLDVASGRAWTAPDSEVRLDRTDEGLTARVRSTIDMDGARAGIDATASYLDESRVINLIADGESFPVGDLLSTFYGERAAILDAPVSGRAIIAFTADGDVLSSQFNAQLGEGYLTLGGERLALRQASWETNFDPSNNRFSVDYFQYDMEGSKGSLAGDVSISFGDDIRNPEIILFNLRSDEIVLSLKEQLPEDLSISAISAEGRYLVSERRLSLSAMEAAFAGVRADGAVTLLRPRVKPGQPPLSPGVIADIKIDGALDPERLLSIWPRSLATGARDWVEERLAAAEIDNLVFKMDLTPGAIAADGGLPDEALRLTFDARNARAFYVNGMTPIRDGAGNGVLGGNSFVLNIDSAKVGAVAITGGEVSFPTFMPKWQPTYYRFTAVGKAQSMLSVLDQAPLSLLSKVDLSPDQFEGDARAVVEIMRPNKRDVLPEEYGYKGKATFENMKLSELIGDIEINGAKGSVDLKTRSMTVEANASFTSDAPIKMVWRQNFYEEDGPSDIAISGIFDSSTGDLFGISTRQILRGPVAFEANATGDIGDFRTLDVKADFTEATLIMEALDWRKPGGAPASGDIAMSFTNEGVDVSSLSLSGAGVDIAGSLSFDNRGALQHGDLSRIYLEDAAEFSLMADRDGAGVLSLTAVGPFLNAGALIQQTLEGSSGAEGSGFDWGAGISIQARIDAIALRNGVIYRDSALDMMRNSERLQALDFTAFGAEGKPLTVAMALTGAEDGPQRSVEARTGALGEFMNGVFGVSSVAKGDGSMRIALHQDGEPGFGGLLEAHNLQMVNAPLLARIFSAGSLDGLANLMNGEGIEFGYAYGEFDYANGVVSVKDMHATGSSVGISAEGFVDVSPNGTADLSGAVAPVYMLNSVLGNAPLIGDILVGKKGEGIVAFTYRVSGETADPTVFVNPLSALTPGIFRQLMQPPRAVAPNASTDPDETEPAPIPDEQAPAQPQE